jgi:hypothetical protein
MPLTRVTRWWASPADKQALRIGAAGAPHPSPRGPERRRPRVDPSEPPGYSANPSTRPATPSTRPSRPGCSVGPSEPPGYSVDPSAPGRSVDPSEPPDYSLEPPCYSVDPFKPTDYAPTRSDFAAAACSARPARCASSATAARAPRTAIAIDMSVGFIVLAVGMRALPPTTRFSKPHTRE